MNNKQAVKRLNSIKKNQTQQLKVNLPMVVIEGYVGKSAQVEINGAINLVVKRSINAGSKLKKTRVSTQGTLRAKSVGEHTEIKADKDIVIKGKVGKLTPAKLALNTVEDADEGVEHNVLIESKGEVIIHGDVKNNVKIIAEGDVILHGHVGNEVEISAGGKIILYKNLGDRAKFQANYSIQIDGQMGENCELNPGQATLTKIAPLMVANIESFVTQNKNKDLFRPYQHEAIASLGEHIRLQRYKGYFLCPTGIGKTQMFIGMIMATPGSRKLIVVPTRVLLKQTYQRIRELAPELDVEIFASDNKICGKDVTITTYQSLTKQINSQGWLNCHDYDMVILDEVHLCLSKARAELINSFNKSIILGFTATDTYNTKRPKGALRSVSELLEHEIFTMSIAEAINNKYLAPCKVIYVTPKLSLELKTFFKTKKAERVDKGVDYSEQELQQALNIDKFNQMIVDIYTQGIDPDTQQALLGKTGLVFCAGIDHAKAVAEKFNQALKAHPNFEAHNIIPAAYISGELDGEEQQKLIALHKTGKIAILCGSDILINGYDNRRLEVCFNARPTCSDVMIVQRAGRVLRPDPDNSQKYALIIEIIWEGLGQKNFDEFLGCAQVGHLPRQAQSQSSVIHSEKNTVDYTIEWDVPRLKQMQKLQEIQRQQELQRLEEIRRQQEQQRLEEIRRQQELQRGQEIRRQQELQRWQEIRSQQEAQRWQEIQRQQQAQSLQNTQQFTRLMLPRPNLVGQNQYIIEQTLTYPQPNYNFGLFDATAASMFQSPRQRVEPTQAINHNIHGLFYPASSSHLEAEQNLTTELREEPFLTQEELDILFDSSDDLTTPNSSFPTNFDFS